MKLTSKQIKDWKKAIIERDIKTLKAEIEQDLKDSLNNGTTLKEWIKQIKRIVKQYKIYEPFKNYWLNYIHVIALQNNPEGYSKL